LTLVPIALVDIALVDIALVVLVVVCSGGSDDFEHEKSEPSGDRAERGMKG